MPGKKNILICPLNWGLGHASRCVPVIRILNEAGNNVIIAAAGSALELLKCEFPQNSFIHFNDYNIRYSKGKNLAWKILFQIPKIVFRIIWEHNKLKSIIKQHYIDVVISDNRFGLWNNNIRSIYITHQLFIKTPGGNAWQEKLLKKIHFWFISKFDVCWIPDLPGEINLSGELSRKFAVPENAKFIGLLSGFYASVKPAEIEYDICVLISGPEPQRTIFQDLLIGQIKNTSLHVVVILGKPSETKAKIREENNTIISFLSPAEIREYFCKSKYVIARSGYSTIMDLAATGRKALLIPTPGQPEQEYLAVYLEKKKLFFTCRQDKFDVTRALEKADEYSGINIEQDHEALKKAILSSIS